MARICIDAGHGGHDPGAVNTAYPKYRTEKDIALEVARELEHELRIRGHEVLMTRDSDVFIELQERCNISNRFGADFFISIHCNAAAAASASGIEVIHANGSRKGRELSASILREMSADFPDLRNRGLKPSKTKRYPRWIRVVHKTNAPAALVELGFLSNPQEGALLNQPANWKKFGRAIAKGMENCTG